MHIYAENEPAMKRNKAVVNDLPGELFNDKFPGNCKYPAALIQASQNQKQTNKRGLAKLLKFKIGSKIMLTVNVNVQDRLIKS